MKESRDTVRYPLSDAQIAGTVRLAASLHTTYIAVDTFWDYPQYMERWVKTIRASHNRVWFRLHPMAWEGDNGVAATMSPAAYVMAERTFLVSNDRFFRAGDILDMNPEPEDSPYWRLRYGPNWTNVKVATDEYNAFYVAVTDTADQALRESGANGVITTIRSTNSWFAQTPSALYPSTVARMGRVTIDSYPELETTDAQTAVSRRLAELDVIERVRSLPIVIGEFGYSNHVNVDDHTQQVVLQAELAALQHLPYVTGLNYWVGPGTERSGGYTHIFAGTTGKWTRRPAASDLGRFYAIKTDS